MVGKLAGCIRFAGKMLPAVRSFFLATNNTLAEDSNARRNYRTPQIHGRHPRSGAYASRQFQEDAKCEAFIG